MNKNNNQKFSNIRIIQRIWYHLTKKRKIQFLAILSLMLVCGFAELFTLASLFPLLTVLTEPSKLWEINFIQQSSLIFGITDPTKLILPLIIIFIFSVVGSGFIRLLNIWINGRFAASVGTEFSYEIFKRNLLQPYLYHLKTNTSKVITASTTQLDATVICINLILQMITGIIVSVGLIFALIFTSSSSLFYFVFTFAIAYLFISFVIKKNLTKDSLSISRKTKRIVKILQEGLGGIREIILDNSHDIYLDIYKENDYRMRRKKEKLRFLGLAPRIGLESLGIIILAFIAYKMSSNSNTLITIIPILGSFILGAQKLLPALQQIYASWAGIKSSIGYCVDVLEMLDNKVDNSRFVRKRLSISDNINLVNLSFKYPGKKNYLLKDFNLKIYKGERIGIIGKTGSGKSTLINIIMGLLEPSKGKLKINDIDIYSKDKSNLLKNWRLNVSHVPQSIFLKDASILENIAFSENLKNINFERVKLVSKKAKIYKYIISLPKGFETFVGERGVKLSGGQIQRIGIARALYKDANLLVLDEATSSLDNLTEIDVMDAIEELGREITVIIIAHRLNTLKSCDRIIELENGKILRDLPPTEILNKNIFFDTNKQK